MVVYGTRYTWSEDGIEWRFEDAAEKEDEHTHSAILVGVKEIGK